MVSVCEVLDLSINSSYHAPVRVICQCTLDNGRSADEFLVFFYHSSAVC